MSKTTHLTTRRQFLKLAGATLGTAVVVSCSPTPTPPPQETTVVPTTAPTQALDVTKAAAASPTPELGAQLVGKLEGPEIILDTAKYPNIFSEAPVLADSVKAGNLPAVGKRLPDPTEVMVIKPLNEIGKYGGKWRRGFTGPSDNDNGSRLCGTDKILFWDYTGTKIMPCLAKGWNISDDGKETTIYLRKGVKWSDGQPLTANDFIFWFEEVYNNKTIVPTPFPEMMINGQPLMMKKVDDYTVVFEFPEPNFLFPQMLASNTFIGAGMATRGAYSTVGGGYCPSHYIKQFLPQFSSAEELDEKAKEAGFDGWLSLFKNKYNWALNPELPVLTPWRTVTPINTPTWKLERNPYYWAVDTDGNQLPYIDEIVFTLAENLEVANLRAIAGEYDIQERHMDLSKLPVFLENQTKGDYTVHLDPALNGADAALHFGMAYSDDVEIAKWIGNRDFRHALSMGIDREQLNEVFWLGLGTVGSVAPAESTLYSPGAEWREKWCTLDIQQANALLDKIGLDKKDAEGYRLRTDGNGRLILEMQALAGAFMPFSQIGEMIKHQWREIGIDVIVKELERSLAFTRDANDQSQITMFQNDGSEMIYLFPRHALPVEPAEAHMGTGFAKWFATGGKEGKKPNDTEMLRAFDLFRKGPTLIESEQIKTAQELWKIICEQQWSVGTVGQSPATMGVRIVKNNMGNVPARQVNATHARTPCSSHPTQFYFKS